VSFFLINLPFYFFGYKRLGAEFTIKIADLGHNAVLFVSRIFWPYGFAICSR